jgi:tyrosyl-tRNA synthetase
MSISDALMWRYIELLSFEPIETMHAWKREVENGRNPRDVKVTLAKEIVERFHGRAAAERACADFEARFRDGAMPENMPEVTLHVANMPLGIAHVLKQAGLTPSTSEALRMIEQGGVRIDGERVSDKALEIAPGTTAVFQVGKRKFARVTLA